MQIKMKSKMGGANTTPVVSKIYCSSSPVVMVVRRRPHVINGGGFVVTDCSQKVVFRVDGCGALGVKGEIVLTDSNGEPLLLIRKKGGVVQALSINKKWKGYTLDYEGSQKLVFTLRDPNPSCLAATGGIKISTEPPARTWLGARDWDMEIKGHFPDRACRIVDADGKTVAEVGTMTMTMTMSTKDVYKVTVMGGVDQAFVFGVIAVLDYIYGESTSCS